MEEVIRARAVDEVIFSYSDVSHEHVMHLASRALAAGADFRLLGPGARCCAPRVRWWRSRPCGRAAGRARSAGGWSRSSRRWAVAR